MLLTAGLDQICDIMLSDQASVNEASQYVRKMLTNNLKGVERLLASQCPHPIDEQGMSYQEKLRLKEELLLAARGWELVRWVSVQGAARGRLTEKEKAVLRELLNKVYGGGQEDMVTTVVGIVIPVPSQGGQSWNSFV